MMFLSVNPKFWCLIVNLRALIALPSSIRILRKIWLKRRPICKRIVLFSILSRSIDNNTPSKVIAYPKNQLVIFTIEKCFIKKWIFFLLQFFFFKSTSRAMSPSAQIGSISALHETNAHICPKTTELPPQLASPWPFQRSFFLKQHACRCPLQ